MNSGGYLPSRFGEVIILTLFIIINACLTRVSRAVHFSGPKSCGVHSVRRRRPRRRGRVQDGPARRRGRDGGRRGRGLHHAPHYGWLLQVSPAHWLGHKGRHAQGDMLQVPATNPIVFHEKSCCGDEIVSARHVGPEFRSVWIENKTTEHASSPRVNRSCNMSPRHKIIQSENVI